jgi:hypothetical protein
VPTRTATAAETPLLDRVRLLSEEAGPRRPTSRAERVGAELMRESLNAQGLTAQLEHFSGYSTFAWPFGLIAAAAIAPALLPRRLALTRSALALGAAAGLISEGGLLRTSISDLLSRRPSQNLIATIESEGSAKRTVCLVCHLDTSRSGLIFHPRFLRFLNPALNAWSAAILAQGAEPLLGRWSSGHRILRATRAIVALGAALIAERELRGEDVPGANDNASGAAVVAHLALEVAQRPLQSTRLVILMTGCEEAGLLGAQAFLRSRDTSGWLFVNFDSVGGAATLRYVRREGLARKWDADPGLRAIAESIAEARPELGLAPSEGPIGLTYDVTPVLASGGRGITFVAGDGGVIPNYHWPTDTVENLDPEALERAVEVGREMLAAIDRGRAGNPG